MEWRRSRLVALIASGLISTALEACGSTAPSECTASTQCDLASGGECKKDPTEHPFCQYPDPTCAGGVRWSAEAGDGLGSVCVAAFVVQVTKQGAGGGSVTSSPGGISCGPTCSSMVADGTGVTLTAAPDSLSQFTGWAGDAGTCGASTVCTLTVSQSTNAVATFSPIPEFSVAVTLPGDGTGRVTSSPGLIDCGSVCLDTFERGTSVKLTATVDSGSNWAGWGGDAASCGLNFTCTLTVDAAKNVTANFSNVPIYQLSVSRAGDGVGSVISDPSGISCDSSCMASYPVNTSVKLTINHDASSVFTGWFGDASSCGVAPTCTILMTSSKQVSARFTQTGTTLWLTSIGGTGRELTRSFVTDKNGDIIVAGVFGSSQFNAGGFPLTNHGAASTSDIFLAKLARDDGHVLWAKAYGGTDSDDVSSVAIDPTTGDVVIFASYIGDSDFGSNTLLPGSAAGDWVVARYSGANGAFEWTRRLPLSGFSPGTTSAHGNVAVGAAGVYVAGFWADGSLDLGDGPRASNGGFQTMFTAKYSLDGQILGWANAYQKAAGQSFGWIEAHALAVDTTDNLVVVGEYAGSVDVGNSEMILTSTSSLAGDFEDGFLAKYAGANGDLLWARSVGGSSSDSCDSVAIGPSNDVVVGCNVNIVDGTLSLDFGGASPPPGPVGGPGPAGANGPEVVVARYSSIDEYEWARRFGGDGLQEIAGIGVDATSGRVLVGGRFSTTMTVDDFSLVRAGSFDNAWAAALAPDTGVAEWAERFAGLFSVSIDAVAADSANGRILVSGSFASLAQFGDQEVMSAGDDDAYVVSIVPSYDLRTGLTARR